ncbi:MAG TPA: PriCT-2 domain-containing protein [Candidatus Paceibacterota bacterium]|nr:PriCT-2 domain-containing protein [Candidatus Paceibacterota bacterium]
MDNILNALERINVSELTYTEWFQVGAALKHEGYDLGVWDNWSKNDSRYKAGECERKWATMTGSSNPITGETIIQMTMKSKSMYMDWDNVIEYDGVVKIMVKWIKYLFLIVITL